MYSAAEWWLVVIILDVRDASEGSLLLMSRGQVGSM